MRKVTRKAFLENAAVFKRDAKRFELGMFDVTGTHPASDSIKINGGNYHYFKHNNELFNTIWSKYRNTTDI